MNKYIMDTYIMDKYIKDTYIMDKYIMDILSLVPVWHYLHYTVASYISSSVCEWRENFDSIYIQYIWREKISIRLGGVFSSIWYVQG